MSAQVIPIRRARRRRIAIELLQYSPEQWLVACECGWSKKCATRPGARSERRRHQVKHDAAVAAHPAGRGLPGGGR